MVRLLVVSVLFCMLLCTVAPACGSDQTGAPWVETRYAADVGFASATLNGRLMGMGDCGSVEVWFVYWTEDEDERETARRTMRATGEFSMPASFLTRGKFYTYYAVAQGCGKKDRGDDSLFDTIYH